MFLLLASTVITTLVLSRVVYTAQFDWNKIDDPLCQEICLREVNLEQLNKQTLIDLLSTSGADFDVRDLHPVEMTVVDVYHPSTNNLLYTFQLMEDAEAIRMVFGPTDLCFDDMLQLYGVPDDISINFNGVVSYGYRDELIRVYSRNYSIIGTVSKMANQEIYKEMMQQEDHINFDAFIFKECAITTTQ